MTNDVHEATCAVCHCTTTTEALARAAWQPAEVLSHLAHKTAGYRSSQGACPACVQQALLETLLARGDQALHLSIQAAWPLDAEAAFGALPTPLRMHADPRFRGRGVTIAMVDSGFYPHPDLVRPANRVKAWVNASQDPVQAVFYKPEQTPDWPEWNAGAAGQWHGTMTTSVAAGNGELSDGLYRGMASEADLVLVQVLDRQGHISNASITRALRWLYENSDQLGVRVINLSLGGDPVASLADNPVDEAVQALVDAGVVVVVAAGNDGERHLVPPATAPAALTVGGIDDKNTFDHDEVSLWHGNYGETVLGALKPELVAPSIWVVAPMVLGTPTAEQAEHLFAERSRGNAGVEAEIAAMKLVTPFYQHVDGTSFAAPLVSSVVACMLQANPRLTPRLVRDVLLAAAHPVPGATPERQGAGALDAGLALSIAARERHGALLDTTPSPAVSADGITFLLHDHNARRVQVLGSWDGWQQPGLYARPVEAGVWSARLHRLAPGTYTYKFLLNSTTWLDDPANPRKAHDGEGHLNSVLVVE